MKLQTKIPLEKQSKNLIDYNSNLLLIGSCFSDNIGKKLDGFKFKNIQNPFGILFHNKAIESLILEAISKKEYSENDIFFHNEQWHSFNAHSKLSNPLKDQLLKTLNKQSSITNNQLHESSHIIITLGTAWVYRFIKNNNLVANCHKIPQKEFLKELIAVNAIVKSLEVIVNSIKKINSKSTIIFTVSPVRHIKDGFVENTLSKAHIIAAIQKFLSRRELNSNQNCYYFPAFEIMMDELRDYRFYEEDMLHPNKIAINYIWECFKNVWISADAFNTMKEVDAIQKGLLHKPFQPNSDAHQKFLKDLEEKKSVLQLQFKHIRF